jgi:hypothetical protein
MSHYIFKPEKLIIDWFERSQTRRATNLTLFDRFISLWFAFNGWGTFITNEDADRTMINHLRTNSELMASFRVFVENDPEFLSKVKRLTEYKVLDMRPGHEGESKSVSDVNSWSEVLEVIYQIRCNLFHGRKSETEAYDRELVELAHYIIDKLFTPIVKEMKTRMRAGAR